jgi:two-component system nitrogen regulation response regulator NtrX
MNIIVGSLKLQIIEDFMKAFGDRGDKVFSVQNASMCFDVLEKENVEICFLESLAGERKLKDLLPAINRTSPKTKVILLNDSLTNICKEIGNNRKQSLSRQDEMMIGKSAVMVNTFKMIKAAALSSSRVLLLGENGTGKEMAAKMLYQESMRAKSPFVCVNCAAIPETLMESEFFGYVKGAFTGATCDRKGKLEQADGGVLFLDEIAEMPLSIQSKLLRALQEMKICRIGSNKEREIDVRIIAATNKDLHQEVIKGRFREDLYYRLNVISIRLPALRERTDDIPFLIDYFAKKLSVENNLEMKKFDKDAIVYLKKYSWPGNVRQLKNFVERLMVLENKTVIYASDVRKYIDEDDYSQMSDDFWKKFGDFSLREARDLFEYIFIEKKLKENHYNLTKTANVLGIFPSNLKVKLSRLKFDA